MARNPDLFLVNRIFERYNWCSDSDAAAMFDR